MYPGQWIADRYIIEAQAGSGGMATVYKAHDRHGRPVAIKVMLHGAASMSERFSREARLLETLEHPAVVRCLDTGVTEDGRHFMVMEWLDGVDLGTYIDEHRLSVTSSLALIARLAEALAVVHAHHVVHRDITPANVFLPNSDLHACKLLDFGIAHWSSASRLTASGSQMGTPSYMAPEQIRGNDVDARADVFSLGCVLYLCLAGTPAYSGHHLHEVYYKILMHEPPEISRVVSGVPQPVVELLRAMMARDRSARPSDAAPVVERIAWIQANVALPDAPLRPRSDASSQAAITKHERRLVSVVAHPVDDTRIREPHGSPAPITAPSGTLDTLIRRYRSLGVRFEYPQAHDVLLAIFDTWTAATDQARDAARFALQVQRSNPAGRIVVATGRAHVTRERTTGEAIDRVCELLDLPQSIDARTVRVCPVTAGLIEQRFDTDRDEHGHRLIRERYLPGQIRFLGSHMPFIGRAREIACFQVTLAECRQESMSRAILITGPMGIGKSRLAQQFLQIVDEHDVHVEVLQAFGDPMRADSPLELLTQVIRNLTGIQEGESDALRRDRLVARVNAVMPPESAERVAMFLTQLIKTPWPDDDVRLRAARRDPQLMGEQIRRAARELLAAETERHPVLLLLENLHWSDRATVAWIDSLLRELRHRPLLVVALGRQQLHEQFPDIWSGHDLFELRLRGLSPRNATKLARSVLNVPTSEAHLDALVRRADGNPLYLEELIRSMAAERPRIPDTVLAMMHVRLQEVPDLPRRVLRAASVVGDPFWRGSIEVLCGRDVHVERELEWLTDNEFLVESRSSRFAGEAEYRFRNDLIREAAYGMLTEDDRRGAHRVIGRWLERAGDTDALVIARHLERGSEHEAARPFLLQAAVSACRTGDLEAAEAIATRGVSLSPGARDSTHGALRAVQVKAYQWRGQLEASLEAGEQALANLTEGSRIWYEVAEDVVSAQSGLDRFHDLERRAESMTEGRPAGHDPSGWLIVAARLAWMLFVHARTSTARALLDRVGHEIGLASGPLTDIEPTVAARIHTTRAGRAWFVDRNPAGLLRELRYAVARYDEVSDAHNACDQRVNVGFAEIALGLYQDAEITLRTALRQAEDLKVERLLDVCRQNLSLALCHLGRLDEAHALASESAHAYEARGSQRLAVGSRIYLSDIARLAGDPVEAREHARVAVSLSPERSSLRLTARASHARALMASQRYRQALDIMTEVMEDAHRTGDFGDSEMTIRLVWAEALHGNDEHARARQAIATAHDRLQELAREIDDESWRESFLHRVPDHARISELFQDYQSQPGVTLDT